MPFLFAAPFPIPLPVGSPTAYDDSPAVWFPDGPAPTPPVRPTLGTSLPCPAAVCLLQT